MAKKEKKKKKNLIWCSYKKAMCGEQRHRGPCEDGGRDWRDVEISPEMPVAIRSWEREGGSSPRALGGSMVLPTP